MDLIALLSQESVIEKEQKKRHKFVPDLPELEGEATRAPKIKEHLFFENKDIYISKHNRYAAYPEHSHQFLELNYIVKGECRQIINGVPYLLKEGDILLMDTGSAHSIEALGKDDLLLNILFNNKSISINWLMNMNHHDSILYKLLLTNNPLDTNAANFILFRNEQNEHIKQIINNMADEYFFPKVFSGKIISSYLPILIYELARSLPHEYSETFSKKDPFYEVLQLIDAEFTTLTLDAASKRLNFNKNYLSNMIKKRSGQTFTELLNEKRLLKANLLIESTEIPIQTILTEVGFSNKTYFYTCYKNRFHCLPSEVRKNGAASK